MAVKVDIVSGFLGAGKTTLIKKLLHEKLNSERVVLIENEFGEIGIDGSSFREWGVEIKEMNSGCICCSLVGDFSSSLKEVIKKYNPERVIIEPSGVGKLSGVIEACKKVENQADSKINMCIAVVDATKYAMYISNFGDFFHDQIKFAKTIILSRTQIMDRNKLLALVKDIQVRNSKANIVTTEWNKLSGDTIVSVAELEMKNSLEKQIMLKVKLHKNILGKNEANHKHSFPATLEKHIHSDFGAFESWSVETPYAFTEEKLRSILNEITNKKSYGYILRAKGIIPAEKDKWLQFDFVPGEVDIKPITPDYTGRICVIGEGLVKNELSRLFNL